MKKLIVFLLVGFLGNLAWAGEQKKDVTERLQMATDVIRATEDASSVPPKERIKEIVLFSISEEYLSLRQKLRITIES